MSGKVVYLFEKDRRPRTRPTGAIILAQDVVRLIKEKFNIRWWNFLSNYRIYIADPSYFPVHPSLLEHIKPTFEYEYITNIFDCDDYSFLKKGYETELAQRLRKNYAFGIIWVYSPTKWYGHALNFFIDQDKQFWFYEPQKDEAFQERIDDWQLLLAVV